jgi:hypothetical protein
MFRAVHTSRNIEPLRALDQCFAALFVYFFLRSKFTAVHEMRLLGAIFKYHDATGRQVVWDSGSS